LGGAVALALHADPTLAPERVEIELDRITETIRARLHSDDPRAAVAHAHAVLFDELGFRGDADDYYNPANSFLSQVLVRRRGLPITLCLLYKLIVEPLGLEVDGLNAPGHFLVAVRGPAPFGRMIVDPFASGRALSQGEAVARVREVSGTTFEGPLPVATHRQWLQRMLRNLVGSYETRNQPDDRAAMEELLALLGS
jgi:regulator of sirC expression with transglutaminase-like and TPR domain